MPRDFMSSSHVSPSSGMLCGDCAYGHPTTQVLTIAGHECEACHARAQVTDYSPSKSLVRWRRPTAIEAMQESVNAKDL